MVQLYTGLQSRNELSDAYGSLLSLGSQLHLLNTSKIEGEAWEAEAKMGY